MMMNKMGTSIRRRPLLALLLLLLSLLQIGIQVCQGQEYEEYEEYSSDEEEDYETAYEPNDYSYRPYDSMRVDDMWRHFDCDRVFAQPRPVHTDQDWATMQEAYQSVVGEARSSLNKDKRDGFAVPVQARQAGPKGRGVFVTGDQIIPKGQLVWSTHKTARFDKGPDYRIFLAQIRPDFACDVLQWAYVQSLSESSSQTERSFVSVDLDAGSFINTVDYNKRERPNLGCDEQAAKEHKGGCQENYFALRNIQVNEELLLDYGDFAISEGWEWFGL